MTANIASTRLALAAALLAGYFSTPVLAQTPFFQGALNLIPGSNNEKCLQTSQYDGAPVVLADCNGSADQEWTFANGAVTIYNGAYCLDATNGANVDGTKLQVWGCNSGNQNQQWYWTWDNHLAWTNHGRCLDLTDGQMVNGNQVQIWDCTSGNPNQIWNVGYQYNALPTKSQNGQTGVNNCQSTGGSSSECQTLLLNSLDDFCLWGPPSTNDVGDSEQYEVAYCTKSTHGARVMPKGTLTGVHYVKTPDYIQITGVGDFTKIHIKAGDEGGELDPHGATGNGNPIGGLVYGTPFSSSGNPVQFHEWTNFMSDSQFCIRACTGPNAAINCNHIYDVMGCEWNMPANYSPHVFESCDGVDTLPMGIYGTSTWYQGVKPTPSAHPIPSSSNCHTTATVGTGS